MIPAMKWLTCTPVSFSGGDDFFKRDSGLLSEGFRALGVESHAIMPLPDKENDLKKLIRVPYSRLVDPTWWKSHDADGVVLYAWGMGEYGAIAESIKKARLKLVSSIDASGLLSPYSEPFDFAKLRLSTAIGSAGVLKGVILGLGAILKSTIPPLHDIPRLRHLENADLVTMVTPVAARNMRTIARRLGFGRICTRIHYVPHPQLPAFRYKGQAKENLVVSVGRWSARDQHQKNPKLLLRSASAFLSTRKDYRLSIVGAHSDSLQPLILELSHDLRHRINLVPQIPTGQLCDLLARAQIFLSSSRYEGQQNSGAQALCSGASIVSTTGLPVNCFEHYISANSGRLAKKNTPESLSTALLEEANSWDMGERCPITISRHWCNEFEAPNVATRILELASQSHP